MRLRNEFLSSGYKTARQNEALVNNVSLLNPRRMKIFVFWVLFSILSVNLEAKLDFAGYRNWATLLVTDCSSDVHKQINLALGGSSSKDAIEIPTTNDKKPHLSCASNSFNGKSAINLTLYTNDNDPATNDNDRQRIEMKVFESSPTQLKATKNTNYIYTWWFHLNPTLKAGDKFFHIFQIKAVGKGVQTDPMATFTLTKEDGLHLRLKKNENGNPVHTKMLSLSSVKGKWIQAYVRVQYMSDATPGKDSTSGSIKVILNDQSGKQLFEKTIYNKMVWTAASFYRPKWGLYRSKSSQYQQPADWELFNDIQIWKKE